MPIIELLNLSSTKTQILFIFFEFYKCYEAELSIVSQLIDNHRFLGVPQNMCTDHVYGFQPIGAGIKIVYIIMYSVYSYLYSHCDVYL